jgi:ribonuclease BN (tRNA processing enzyme)
MAEFALGADLFLVESTLLDISTDDPRRGHLMPDEAIAMAHQADARSTLLVHYLPDHRGEIEAMCAADDPSIRVAVAGLVRTVSPATPPARVS